MYRSASALARLGLRSGEAIRFKRNDRGRYIVGRVEGVETDGSVTLAIPTVRPVRCVRNEWRSDGPDPTAGSAGRWSATWRSPGNSSSCSNPLRSRPSSPVDGSGSDGTTRRCSTTDACGQRPPEQSPTGPRTVPACGSPVPVVASSTRGSRRRRHPVRRALAPTDRADRRGPGAGRGHRIPAAAQRVGRELDPATA